VRYGFPGGGPEWLVTELGVFDFLGGSGAGGRDSPGRMRLRQRYPDVTVEEIRAATAFELAIADDLDTVPPPEDEALAVIREVDPLGIRNREFSDRELQRRYRFRDQTPHLCPHCL
jgi:glutaconate CoA-transferase, subunit B